MRGDVLRCAVVELRGVGLERGLKRGACVQRERKGKTEAKLDLLRNKPSVR